MRISLEERACDLAVYIIENQTTVRAAAKKFGVSKSTVHTDKTIWNDSYGGWHKKKTQYIAVNTPRAGAAAPALGVFFNYLLRASPQGSTGGR
ncbi:MAG: sporulation transcriptional regulator SpoIIID [Oscillospiraceae bacterium]|nr:sporulation transcriptional regulator SpoIIID [Oscillospiraceae bacterium]